MFLFQGKLAHFALCGQPTGMNTAQVDKTEDKNRTTKNLAWVFIHSSHNDATTIGRSQKDRDKDLHPCQYLATNFKMKLHFLPTNASLFRRGLHLEQQGLEHDEEDPATQLSVEFKAASVSFQAPLPPLPSRTNAVRFDESQNKTYDNDLVDRDECASFWYNNQDIHRFRMQTRKQNRELRTLLSLSGNENQEGIAAPSWAKAYSDVYQACCQVKSDDEDNQRIPLETHVCTLDIFTIGMEKRAVAAVAQDAKYRRQTLRNEVFFWQSTHLYGNAVKSQLVPHMIREASRKVSRPSRLYAQHIAAVSAATEL